MLVGGTVIASVQLAIILYKGMDAINIISFTILQYLYMDLVKSIFEIKMEEAEENNGK